MERLRQIAAKPERRIVGLMSGTSADGVDAALVRVRGHGPGTQVAVEKFCQTPFETSLRQGIFALFESQVALDGLCRLNVQLGQAFAAAALAVIEAAGLQPTAVDLIGSHGQTVRHLPDEQPPSTLQIGEPAVIAAATGIATVADFRPADMAVGGQGAPLVPWVDYLLFGGRTGRVLLNIGGISNATLLPAEAAANAVLAFDLGPGNALIDAAAQRFFGQDYDEDGRLAAAGTVDEKVLQALLEHPYFRRPPPKSTGREAFGAAYFDELAAQYALEPAAWMATLTALSAHAIADGIQRFGGGLDEVWVSGGGAYNTQLMRLLAQRMPDRRVAAFDELGIGADAKEAVAFAVLANETLFGGAGNLPSATGARRPMILGKICQAAFI